jgi:N-acetylglucosaminyldiphosphoundecaprenol N-acetyl-beta-D-mannosaminyltransferase
MNKKAVLNSFISIGTMKEFIDEIFNLVREKVPSYICFANVHMVMEGYKDSVFQRIVNQANLTAPDGKPISLFLKFFEKIKQVRVCGMDLLPKLLKQAESSSSSVYFYGTTNELLTSIIKKAKSEFPNLKICGSYSPPFRPLTEVEDNTIVELVKKASPDLVFVSLGCPKQEKWMASHKDKIGACLLGVGQAFKVYAGAEKRLPTWMRNLSLEWTYRLFLEPKRLWKRYLFTN